MKGPNKTIKPLNKVVNKKIIPFNSIQNVDCHYSSCQQKKENNGQRPDLNAGNFAKPEKNRHVSFQK